MKKSYLKLIGYACVILGIPILIGAMFFYFYSETYTLWDQKFTVYPHQKTAWPLLISGAILLFIGLDFLWQAKQKK